MRLGFGPYEPDLPPMMSAKTLVTAKNVRVQLGGYEPIKGLTALPGADALTARPRGSISGIDPSGGGYVYAGSGSTLEVQGDSGWVDVSKAGGYSLLDTDRWDFAQFGNYIYTVTPSEVLQYHQIGSTTPFADVPSFAPRARHVATIGNHLFCGNLYDAEGGPMVDTVRWPGIDLPLNWPAFGSDAAVSIQADRQPLEGDGGWVQDVVSSAEAGAVFQERQIHRFDYVGGQKIYSRKRLGQGNGMLIPHSGVAFDRMIFYIGEDGFRVFNMLDSDPIGKD